MGHVLACVAVVAGCYAPSPPTGSPCPDGRCPSPLVCSSVTQTCEREMGPATPDSAIAAATDYAYRVPITFEASAASTSAIKLILFDATFPYAHAAPDGSDLRIAVADIGDTPYWIETWDPAGTSRIWANVPSVEAGTNTVYAYYGRRDGTVASTSSFSMTFPDTLRTTGNAVIDGTITHDAVIVELAHTLTVMPGAPLDIEAAYVEIAGALDASGAGHDAAMGPGAGGGSTTGGAGGGGHGGTGGLGGRDAADMPGAGGVVNGSASGEDVDMGSGGGTTDVATMAGRGGGAVRIHAQRIVLSGAIDVRGLTGVGASRSSGAGAGGGVMLRATSLAFTGTIAADGGDGASGPAGGNDGGGGGGGGRIKLFSRAEITNTGMTSVAGGASSTGGDTAGGEAGSPGVVFTGTTTTVPPSPTVGGEQLL